MMFAIISNIPTIAAGVCWTWVMIWLGMRFERWRTQKHFSLHPRRKDNL